MLEASSSFYHDLKLLEGRGSFETNPRFPSGCASAGAPAGMLGSQHLRGSSSSDFPNASDKGGDAAGVVRGGASL